VRAMTPSPVRQEPYATAEHEPEQMANVSGFSACFIGNSHLAALKQSWANRPPAIRPNFQINWFAVRGELGFRALRQDKGALVPMSDLARERLLFSSDGQEKIELSHYDAFVLYGAALGGLIDTLAEFCAEYGTTQHTRLGPINHLISRACFSEL